MMKENVGEERNSSWRAAGYVVTFQLNPYRPSRSAHHFVMIFETIVIPDFCGSIFHDFVTG